MKDKRINHAPITLARSSDFSFILLPSSFILLLYSVHPAAFRRFRLVTAGEPIDIFTRAVASDLELRSPHILELDLYGIAGIHGTQPLMIGAGCDHVSGIELEEPCQPGDLIRNLMGHVFGIVVLPRLAARPGFNDDIVRIGNLIFGDDPRPAGAMRILTFRNELRAPHQAAG